MRLQITVDDVLGHELKARAHDLGLSVSSYVRYMLKKFHLKISKNIMEQPIPEIYKNHKL